MTRVSVAEARRDLAEILNRVSYGRDRVVVTRHDTDVAAVISMGELRLLDVLIERYEDESDIADAHEALFEASEQAVAWETVKRDLDL